MSGFVPMLRVTEGAGAVTLCLDRFFCGEGPTLQEAADELVRKALVALMAFRSHGVPGLSVLGRPDPALVDFLWELDQVAAEGGDVRDCLLGPRSMAA